MVNGIGPGMPAKASLLAACLLPLLSTPVTSYAKGLELTGGLDTRFTDNAKKSSDNKTSDSESRAYLRANYKSEPGRCNSSFAGTLGYSYWQQESFDNETFADMDFNGSCELANQLYWDVSNNLHDVSQDTKQNDTQSNRTRKNVFSTGPRYLWRLTNTDLINLSTRYENTEFSEPEDNDSERYTGSVAWNHLFSETFSGGLSSSYSRTELDTGAEVDVQAVNLIFSQLWTTTTLAGSVGVSKIESRIGSTTQSSDGLVGTLDITRNITPSADWFFHATRELTDRTSDFSVRFGDLELNLKDSLTVETTRVSTGINKQLSDTGSLNISLFANRTDYLETDGLEDRAGINFRYTRPIASLTKGYVALGYDYLSFQEDNRDDTIARLELGVEHQASRNLSLVGKLGHEGKGSDDPVYEYDENWVLLGVEYRFR
jgi:hypothetical protein